MSTRYEIHSYETSGGKDLIMEYIGKLDDRKSRRVQSNRKIRARKI